MIYIIFYYQNYIILIMNKSKKLIDVVVVPLLFICTVFSYIYQEPSKSDQILLIIFAGAFWIIDIILSKNEKQKN